MTEDEATLRIIQNVIKENPPEIQEAVHELAEHFRRQIAAAGEPVGRLALGLVGAELAAQEDIPY